MSLQHLSGTFLFPFLSVVFVFVAMSHAEDKGFEDNFAVNAAENKTQCFAYCQKQFNPKDKDKLPLLAKCFKGICENKHNFRNTTLCVSSCQSGNLCVSSCQLGNLSCEEACMFIGNFSRGKELIILPGKVDLQLSGSRLNWTEYGNPNITAYLPLYQAVGSNQWNPLSPFLGTEKDLRSERKFECNTKYKFRVAAFNETGRTKYSSVDGEYYLECNNFTMCQKKQRCIPDYCGTIADQGTHVVVDIMTNDSWIKWDDEEGNIGDIAQCGKVKAKQEIRWAKVSSEKVTCYRLHLKSHCDDKSSDRWYYIGKHEVSLFLADLLPNCEYSAKMIAFGENDESHSTLNRIHFSIPTYSPSCGNPPITSLKTVLTSSEQGTAKLQVQYELGRRDFYMVLSNEGDSFYFALAREKEVRTVSVDCGTYLIWFSPSSDQNSPLKHNKETRKILCSTPPTIRTGATPTMTSSTPTMTSSTPTIASTNETLIDDTTPSQWSHKPTATSAKVTIMTSKENATTATLFRTATARLIDDAETQASSPSLLTIVVPVVCVALIFVALVIVFAMGYVRREKRRFINNRPETKPNDPSPPFDVHSSEPPDDWEIDPNDLSLLGVIGEGFFGVVLRAEVVHKPTALWLTRNRHNSRNMREPSMKSDRSVSSGSQMLKSVVACKMLKENGTYDQQLDLIEEIKLMKRIGQHQHIVSMLGCVTRRQPLCLIVEYCPHGDLLKYLKEGRKGWVSESRRQSVMSQAKDDQGYIPMNRVSSASYVNVSKQRNLSNKDEDEDDFVQFTAFDLLSFAWQIATGMEYLTGKGLVHRDLACRNVLVCDDKLLKVSDFGLTRAVHQDGIYPQKTARRLPFRWMSVEAITDRVFTEQSDIWSFGVVVWEICTLGTFPYPSVLSKDLLTHLRKGNRLARPENCSEELYRLMSQCWHLDSGKRPTFSSLAVQLGSMLEAERPSRYLNLDFSYSYPFWDLDTIEETDTEDRHNFDPEIDASVKVSLEKIAETNISSTKNVNDGSTCV